MMVDDTKKVIDARGNEDVVIDMSMTQIAG